MSTVIVVLDLETSATHMPAQNLELVTIARELGEVTAVSLAGALGAEQAQLLGSYGVKTLLSARDAEAVLAGHAGNLADALDAAITHVGAELVLTPSTYLAREVAARVAVRRDWGIITDAEAALIEGSELHVRKSVFAAAWGTQSTLRGPGIITLKPNVITSTPAAVAVEATEVELDVNLGSHGVSIVERTEIAGRSSVDLGAADVIVSGGRGVNGDFSLVEELAELLNGAVGASRVAVDDGWIDHAHQVGQTGTVVTPRLIISAGISGAIQYRAGMQTAKTIISINTDPEALIFEFSDVNVIGDLNAVLPALIAELRARKG